MSPLVVMASLLAGAPSIDLARKIVAETALAQAEAPDPRWQPSQRDCAGLVRFAYRAAWQKLDPARLAEGPWVDGRGKRTAFADAETLISGSFALLGRDRAALAGLKSGDLLAFEQESGEGGAPEYHLMIVVGSRVVYHPGPGKEGVRVGKLAELLRDAPHEWRPVPENGAFLGFFRLKEWMS